MRVLGSLANFVLGACIGAAAAAIVTMMLTPKSGADLKLLVRQRLDEGRAARAQAEAEMTAELTQRFRQKVADPNALSQR